MRRRWQKFLPIVLIALLVQILAPVGACWAAAIAASDPLQAAEICRSSPDLDPGQTDRGAGHTCHDVACTMCCVLHANASMDAPHLAAFPTPYRGVERVVWREKALQLSTARSGSNSQPRAPPPAI